MRMLRPLVLAPATLTTLMVAGYPAAASPPPAGPAGGLPAAAVAQIDALAQAKTTRTPAQRKVDSRLLAESRQRRGLPLAAGVRAVRTGVTVDAAGLTTVDVRGQVGPALTARIHEVGGRVRASYPREGTVRADIPLSAVEALAASAQVSRVSVAATAFTATAGARAGGTPPTLSKDERDARLRQRVSAALAQARSEGRARTSPSGQVTVSAGTVTSEGDVVHAADAARARFKVSGVGVTVGVLSDGVDSLAASVASGDLPPDVRVVPGQAGSGDEGTAMLEIVHDVAPKAKLVFATAGGGIAGFAENIRAVRAAGADIIVDDVVYLGESPFQDGPIAQAVTEVTAQGALYFSSAGNEGNVDDGTSGNYEGDFVSSGQGIGKYAGLAHDFDPGPGVQPLDPVTPGSAGTPAILQWADPLGGSANDYDLYALDPSGNVVAFSNDVQDGDDDPFEGFFLPLTELPYRLAVLKFSGADRYLQLTDFRGRFASSAGLSAFSTPGVTRGHSSVPAAFSTAAAPASTPLPFDLEPGDPPNPSGPFPNVFSPGQLSERFTSDGPRRVFFDADGTPVTPGNFSSTGGAVRQKPDITAADGVTTSVPGFAPFFGTSAAAPHAAAVAALVLSGNPGISPAEVRSALLGTALDVEAPGTDRDTGAGILRADRILRATGATPQPYVLAGDPVVTTSTDGDGFLEPGETAAVVVPVTNGGDAAAQKVSVQLTATGAGVTVRPAVRSYGRVAVGETKTARAFAVTVPATAPLGSVVELGTRVSFVGALSPQRSTGRIVVGEPSPEVVTAAFTGPPVPIPDNSPTGASVSLPVRGVGPVSRATFSVDGTACTAADGSTTVGIDHTFVGDLVGTLTAPDGTAVELFSRVGGTGGNICQAVFDDAATRSIQSAEAADAPFTGTWQPEQPLSALRGRSGDGTWTFSVVDNANQDVGSVRAVSLHLSGYVTAP